VLATLLFKKEPYATQGRRDFSPALVKHSFDYATLVSQASAALGTTTGQNLAAVGSSHSLTETVNLGTVAAAGLVGTLHSDTPPMMKFYAQYRTYRHSNPFLGTNTVVPMYYNRKATVGQPSFFLFFQGSC
jgi:hypothetical protein